MSHDSTAQTVSFPALISKPKGIFVSDFIPPHVPSLPAGGLVLLATLMGAAAMERLKRSGLH